MLLSLCKVTFHNVTQSTLTPCFFTVPAVFLVAFCSHLWSWCRSDRAPGTYIHTDASLVSAQESLK